MKSTATRDEFDAAFARERQVKYPLVDEMESELGFKLREDWLLSAARVLACPVKANPPNWQHGRVLYASLRAYLVDLDEKLAVHCLDVGTAKGFSALVMARALLDSGRAGLVTSIDVIDPDAAVRRNTVVEVDGYKTLREIVEPWREEATLVTFVLGKAENWLMMNNKRIHFAFVDGKHAYESVRRELASLQLCQKAGDMIVCDDLQVPGVRRAVDELRGYRRRDVKVLPEREYAVMRKM